jgi:2-polyprenyl-6-hydroxyphenyl methylase/3-demethylubiquinone-9 3-methyltransferase
LVAHRLGAHRIVSVDVDPDCVECAAILRGRFAGNTGSWKIEQGSVLDTEFLTTLGTFKYVYAWGVLHATGAMWPALEHCIRCVGPSGCLHIALYNHHRTSPFWLKIKQACNRSPRLVFPAVKATYAAYALSRRIFRLELPNSFIRDYRARRGMNFWRDVDDWLCGLPYEYCTPEDVIEFLVKHRFGLSRLRRTTSTGCNEFLFRREPQA